MANKDLAPALEIMADFMDSHKETLSNAQVRALHRVKNFLREKQEKATVSSAAKMKRVGYNSGIDRGISI